MVKFYSRTAVQMTNGGGLNVFGGGELNRLKTKSKAIFVWF